MNTINPYLDDETIDTLKSTVDFLAEHGLAITQLFYQKLFAAHPELKNVFNMTHQQGGEQQQALAKAVYGFAANLDNLDNLAEQISRITHKHTSLNVQAEHYPIVGENLLAAIHDIVTAAIDSETADTLCTAWGKGYGVLSNLLINKEKALYDEAENQLGGWKGLREFILVKREQESQDITSFYIQPADKKDLPVFKAGQYMSVYIKAEDWEYQQIRQYSLSDAYRNDCYRLTIKKEGQVSSYLHDHWQVGESIQATPPAGDFHLQSKSATPVVLLAAGVGVTPMVSIMQSVLENHSAQKVFFAHAVKNSQHHAFKPLIHATEQQYADRFEKIIFYENPLTTDHPERDYDAQGKMDLTSLQATWHQPDADYYLCGPKPFMASIHSILSNWGVSSDRIHYEVFGADKSLN